MKHLRLSSRHDGDKRKGEDEGTAVSECEVIGWNHVLINKTKNRGLRTYNASFLTRTSPCVNVEGKMSLFEGPWAVDKD